MRTPSLAGTVACVAVAACAAPQLPRVEAGTRFEARGYAFRAPAGGWYELPTGSPLLTTLTGSPWGGAGWRGSAHLYAFAFEAGDAPGPDGVREAYRRARGEFHDPKHFRLVEERYEPAAGPGKDCIRLETTFEFWLRKVRRRTLGVACRHPRATDVAVALLASVRTDETAPGMDEELAAFLATFELTDGRPVPAALAFLATYGPGRVLALAPGSGGVWVAGAGSAYAVDRTSAAATRALSVGLMHASELVRNVAIVEDAGRLWIATDSFLLDDIVSTAGPREEDATTVARLGWSPRSIAAAGGEVFVAGGHGIHRMRSAEDPVRVRRGSHWALASVGGLLWAFDEERAAYVALDPATAGERGPAVPLAAKPEIVSAAGDVLYLVDGSRQVLRLDTASRQVTPVLALRSPAGGACVRRGALWLSLPDEGVLRAIDPASGRAVDELPFHGAGPLLCDGDAIWVGTRGGVVRLVP